MLDNDNHGEGEPIPDDGPEWGSVEEECAYWKGLALSYGAKLKAIEHTMTMTWVIESDNLGMYVRPEPDVERITIHVSGLSDIAKKL